jgi:hypothetical protein
MSSASTILPSGAVKHWEQSFATWSGTGLSLSRRIARLTHLTHLDRGLPSISRYQFSRVIVASATARPSREALPNDEQIADRWHLMEILYGNETASLISKWVFFKAPNPGPILSNQMTISSCSTGRPSEEPRFGLYDTVWRVTRLSEKG